MANEVTISASLGYSDGDDVDVSVAVQNQQRTPTTKRPLKTIQAIGTAEEALQVGDGASFGDLWVRNLDATNFVNVKVATGGAICAKLLPGRFMLIPLGSGMQAPFAIADTAACNVEIMVVPV